MTVTTEQVDANHNRRRDAGDQVVVRYHVTNTGATTASALKVSDPAASVNCAQTVLAAGAATTCSGIHTITVADMDRGAVVSNATIAATSADGRAVTTKAPGVTAKLTGVAQLTAQQEVASFLDRDRDRRLSMGDGLAFSLKVTNTGTVTLSGITVKDSLLDQAKIGFRCAVRTLAPGQSTTCTSGIYTVGRYQAQHRLVTNWATAAATTSSGAGIHSNSTVLRRAVVAPPAQSKSPIKPKSPKAAKPKKPRTVYRLALQQWVSAIESHGYGNWLLAGDAVTYSFRVSNTGNQTVSRIRIQDKRLTAAHVTITCPAATLAPETSMLCKSGPYRVTGWQAQHGLGTNYAVAIGARASGAPVNSNLTRNDHGLTATPDPAPLPTALAYTGSEPLGVVRWGVILGALGVLLRFSARPRSSRRRGRHRSTS